MAEGNQAATHLPHSILSLIPRPLKVRQREGQDPGSEELEQEMGYTQEERPAPHSLARAALIVPKPQLFDLIDIDFNLEAACIGEDCLYRIEGQIGAEQIPGREVQMGYDQEH